MHHSTRSRLLTTFAGAFSALMLASSAQAGSLQQKPGSNRWPPDTYVSQYATGLLSDWDDEERAKLWMANGCLTIGSQVKFCGFGYPQSNVYCHSAPADLWGRVLPRTDTVFGTDPYGRACDPGADAVTVGVPSDYRDVPLFPATIPFNHDSDGYTLPNAFGISFNIPVDANGIATSPTGTLSVTVNWDDYSRNKAIVVMYPLRRADMVTLKRTTTYGVGYVFGLKNDIDVDYTPPTPPSSEGPGSAGGYTVSYTTRYNMVYDAPDILTESLGAGYIDELLEPINKYNASSPMAFEDLRTTPGEYFLGVLNLNKPVSTVPASASAPRFSSSSLYSQISAADTNAALLAGLNTRKLARQYIPVGDCTSNSALTLRPDVLRSKLDAAISAHRTLNLNGDSVVWQDFRAGKQEIEMPKLKSTTSTDVDWLKQTLTPGGSYVTHIEPETGIGCTRSVAPDSVTPPVMLAATPLDEVSFLAKDADPEDPKDPYASFSNRFGLSHAYLINRLSLGGMKDSTLSMQPYKGFLVPGSNTAGKPLMWHWGSSDNRINKKGWPTPPPGSTNLCCWYDRLLGMNGDQGHHTQTLSGVEPGYYLVRVVGVRYHHSGGRADYGMGQTYFVVRLGVATSEPTIPPPPPKGIREFAFANVSTANGAALGADKLFTYDATTKKFVPTAVARQEALKNGDFRERVTFDGPMTPEEAANWDVQNSANFCYELVKETDAENPTNPTNPTNPPVVVQE